MNWKLYTRVSIFGCFGWGLVVAALGQDAAAQADKDFEQELRYAEKLRTEYGMPDLAEIVTRRMSAKYTGPQFAARLQAGQISELASQKKFDEALKIIAAQPDKDAFSTWRMRLTLAEGYYSYSQFDDYLKVNQDFFKAFPKAPEGEEKIYMNMAYQFAQLLSRQKRFAQESIAAYRHLLSQKMQEDELRFLRSEMVTQMIKVAGEMTDEKAKKALLTEADKENDKQFWIQDARFGQAIVAKAHIMSLQGNAAGAQDMVEMYMPQLKTIHDTLVQQSKEKNDPSYRRESPMPQCRYLLASLLWAEVQKIAAQPVTTAEDNEKILTLLLGAKVQGKRKANGAFNHFINVFVNYPDSEWALDAGEESEKIIAFIKERFNTVISSPIPPDALARMRKAQYDSARTTFMEQDFPKAVTLLEAILSRYPDTREAIDGHVMLAQSYGEIANSEPEQKEVMGVYMDTVAHNLAERFSGLQWKADAGVAVRNLADKMADIGYPQKRIPYYHLYFKHYADDAAVPAYLHRFAEEAYKGDDIVDAQKYYTMLANYTDYQSYPEVLGRLAAIAKKQGSITNELAYLDQALDAYKARKDKRNEAAYLGTLMMRAGETRALALQGYTSTNQTDRLAAVATLAKAAMLFRDTAKEVEEALKTMPGDNDLIKLQEAAAYYYASTLEYINYPPEKSETFRKNAIAAYEDFVKRFPKASGDLAPRALVQIGTLYTTLGDAKSAQLVFDRLAKEYPESEAAKNSVPMLAKALMELNFTGEAVKQYRQMFSERGKFTSLQYFDAGQALLNARDYGLALEAFDITLQKAEGTLQMEAALGRARALFELKRYDDAQTALVDFEKKYAGYERILDAWYLLAEVYSVTGENEKDNAKRTKLFNNGMQTLKKIGNYQPSAEGKAKTDLAAAKLLIRRMNAENKLGLTDIAKDTCGKAAQGFLALMQIPPGNEKLGPILQDAYKEGIPLFIEFGAPDIAVERCNAYLATFPEGRHAAQVRIWLNQASAMMLAQ